MYFPVVASIFFYFFKRPLFTFRLVFAPFYRRIHPPTTKVEYLRVVKPYNFLNNFKYCIQDDDDANSGIHFVANAASYKRSNSQLRGRPISSHSTNEHHHPNNQSVASSLNRVGSVTSIFKNLFKRPGNSAPVPGDGRYFYIISFFFLHLLTKFSSERRTVVESVERKQDAREQLAEPGKPAEQQ